LAFIFSPALLARRSHGSAGVRRVTLLVPTPSHEEDTMPEPTDTTPEPADTAPEPEEIEVVAHSYDDEELNAGCVLNNSQSL
jgi:hypothetical protein